MNYSKPPTVEVTKSRTLPNFVVKVNGRVLDCCRSRKDALMLKRWFEQQLEQNPKKPFESWKHWEQRLPAERPQTFAWITSKCRGKETLKLVKG